MKYFHVDVFSPVPLAGNGLCVLIAKKEIEAETMRKAAREFNQFETVFLFPQNGEGAYPARIFTVEEELPFAGHPVLGAAAALHRLFYAGRQEAEITLDLSGRAVRVLSAQSGGVYTETMDQGAAKFLGGPEKSRTEEIARRIGLKKEDIHPALPLEVVSTGLAYLLVPLRSGIGRARITGGAFESFLASMGAKFVYVFDPDTLQCRTWDNEGRVEDVATGSAAGPLCAYLVRHGRKDADEKIRLIQGEYAGRKSSIEGWVTGGTVKVRGAVAFFAEGECAEL